jgi:hypothetical protein
VRRFTQAMDWKERNDWELLKRVTLHTNYFKGIHSFKTHKQKLVTLDRPEELFAALNEIEESYAGYEVV